MIQEGIYKARIRNKKDSYGLGKNAKGTNQFVLSFDVIANYEDGEDIPENGDDGKPLEKPQRVAILYITQATWERTLRELQSIGYPHKKLIPRALNPGNEPEGEAPGSFDFAGREFLAQVKHEEYNNKMRERWSIYRPRVGPMTDEDVSQFESQFGEEPAAGPTNAPLG